jgi:hypothetical protein
VGEVQVKAVAGAVEDLFVVGALVLMPEEEGLHAGALEGELELVGAVGGVDVDEGGSGAGTTHVHHDPFNAIGGPDADAVAAPDAEGPEAAGDAVGLFAELGPSEAAVLMAGGDGEAVRVAGGGAVEQVADGELEQWVAGAARVAHGAEVFINGHGGGIHRNERQCTPVEGGGKCDPAHKGGGPGSGDAKRDRLNRLSC